MRKTGDATATKPPADLEREVVLSDGARDAAPHDGPHTKAARVVAFIAHCTWGGGGLVAVGRLTEEFETGCRRLLHYTDIH